MSADRGTFRHFFGRKDEFEDAMVELNVIRREEAHNREITHQHLLDLEKLHESLLSNILLQYPDIELSYMVDYWKSKIKSIMVYENHLDPIYTADEYEQSTDEVKRQLILQDSTAQIKYVNKIASDLKSISPPISKKQKHEELIKIIIDYSDLQRQKHDCALSRNEKRVPEILAAIRTQLERINSFADEFILTEG